MLVSQLSDSISCRTSSPGAVHTWRLISHERIFFSPFIEPQAELSFLAGQWIEFFSPSFHGEYSSKSLAVHTHHYPSHGPKDPGP